MALQPPPPPPALPTRRAVRWPRPQGPARRARAPPRARARTPRARARAWPLDNRLQRTCHPFQLRFSCLAPGGSISVVGCAAAPPPAGSAVAGCADGCAEPAPWSVANATSNNQRTTKGRFSVVRCNQPGPYSCLFEIFSDQRKN